MRTAIVSLCLLLPGLASAQQGLQSYTPEPKTDAPTFINAEVVRVNRDNTATFRSESGEITLAADDSTTAAVGALHAGDKVLVEYREVRDANGRVARYVTSVKAASPSSGEPGRLRAASASLSAGSTVRARVLSYDTRRRRVTLIDESGVLRALPVRSGIGGLADLVPGANVAFNVGAGTAAGSLAVTGITPLGTTPVFASNNAFPGVNGQFVSFNSKTGLVTLNTTSAGRVTFPVAANIANSFTGIPQGTNLNFGFDVTNGQTQTGTTNFTPAPVVNVTGFQPLTTAGGAAGPIPGTMTGAVPAVMPTGTVGGQVVGGPAVGATPVSNTVGGFAVGGATGATGTTAPGGSGTVGGMAVGGTTGTGVTGATTGAVGVGQAVGGGVVGSPFGNPVPSIPAATPTAGVVLPPAGAKEPLSAAEVGTMRAQGERDLDASAVALASAAARIDPVWAGFKNQCLSGFTVNTTVSSGREWYLLADDRIPTPTDDGCRAAYADLKGRAQGFLSQLETVEDAARKADVLPARVREVLDRHKL
jgi:hypothetical protein